MAVDSTLHLCCVGTNWFFIPERGRKSHASNGREMSFISVFTACALSYEAAEGSLIFKHCSEIVLVR